MTTSRNDTNLSLTINDLSIGEGLLGVSCSGLLSSPDTSTDKINHDLTICSCHGGDDTCKNYDCHSLAPTSPPNIEVGRGGGEGVIVSNQNTECSIPNGNHSNSDTGYNVDDIHSPTLPETREKEDEGIMTLFNDTSSTLSRFLNRDHNFSNKLNDTSLSASYRLSFADSTQFYSLAAGNLQDCLDEEDDDTAMEDNDNDDGPVLSMNGNSLISINTSQRNVTFRTKSTVAEENEHNEFLNSHGDVNAEKFHDQAVSIEENISKRDKMIKNLVEALELTFKEKEAKETENEALLDQISKLEAAVNKQSEDDTERKRENLSPTTETYSSHSEPPNSEVEDLKLQIANLEKKLEADRKYLDAQTVEREMERDDFQRTITDLTVKIDDMKKEKERFDILVSNQKTEIEDYEVRLRDVMEIQNEAVCRNDKIEEELKSAVEKIHELREIIRDLEEQIDGATKNVCELKEENQLLNEERLRLESLKAKTDEIIQTTEEIGISCNPDLTDELHAQVEDLTRRLERKLNDMDNFQWSTRPNSSCSNAVSVSNEDISVGRDLGYMNRDKDCVPQDIVTLLSDGLRKLDAQFESLVRFEEIIMKKLRDSELRLCNTNKIQEDLENEKLVLHDKIKSQIMKISDLENRLDQFRFEPSPNAVTLSGLRARVTTLSNEVSELNGQLQLKEIELQDLSNKLASKEALVSKLSMKPPQNLPPPVKKYSVSLQTEKENIQPQPSAVKQQSAFTQTTEIKSENDSLFKIPKKTKNIAVQTTVSYSVETDSLEISRIPGIGPIPVTHSTPNDPISILKHSSRNLRQKLSEEDKSLKGNFASNFDLDRSPEILRDPSESRLNHSFASDKIPRIPDLNEFAATPKPYVKSDSDYGTGNIAARFNKMKDVEERSVGTVAGSGINPFSAQNEDYSAASGGTDRNPGSSGAGTRTGSGSGAGTRNGSETGSGSRAGNRNGPESGSGAGIGNEPSSSNYDATALEAKNDSVTKRTGLSDSVVNQLNQGQNPDDDQELPFGPSERSVTEPAQRAQDGDRTNCIGMDRKLMAQVKSFLHQLKNDPSFAKNLSNETYKLLEAVMQFLVDKDKECPKSSDDELSHSYEVVTVTDFAWDNQSQHLSVLNTQGKIVPIDGNNSRGHIQIGGNVIRVGDVSSQAPTCGTEDRGTDADTGPVGTTGVDWDMLEKSRQGRQTETASLVELETLKTQMNMLQQALTQEKEENAVLHCDLERLSRAAGSGDLNGRVEEYKYENDQQRAEIDRLRNHILQIEGHNSTAIGYDPNFRQQQGTRYGTSGGECIREPSGGEFSNNPPRSASLERKRYVVTPANGQSLPALQPSCGPGTASNSINSIGQNPPYVSPYSGSTGNFYGNVNVGNQGPQPSGALTAPNGSMSLTGSFVRYREANDQNAVANAGGNQLVCGPPPGPQTKSYRPNQR